MPTMKKGTSNGRIRSNARAARSTVTRTIGPVSAGGADAATLCAAQGIPRAAANAETMNTSRRIVRRVRGPLIATGQSQRTPLQKHIGFEASLPEERCGQRPACTQERSAMLQAPSAVSRLLTVLNASATIVSVGLDVPTV